MKFIAWGASVAAAVIAAGCGGGDDVNQAVEKLIRNGYVAEWCTSPDIAGDAQQAYADGVAAPGVIRAWEERNDVPEGTWYTFAQRVIADGGCPKP